MQLFARAMGYLFLGSGVLMMGFPETTRKIIKVRAEFAHLSPGALRLLGFVYFLTGGMLVSVTRPSALEMKAGKPIERELHRAA